MDDKIIIYGAGKLGKQFYATIKKIKMEHIVGSFCDKNHEQIKKIDEVAVCSYEQVKDKGQVFVVCLANAEEVIEQLEKDSQCYYYDVETWLSETALTDVEKINFLSVFRNLNLQSAVRVTNGNCPCCGRKTTFIAKDYWLRDYYQCVWCGSIPRQRGIMKVIRGMFPDWKDLKIHESSPSGATYNVCKKECKNYTYSFWYEDKPLGEVLGNDKTNQNLEMMTFEDEEFDLFITQDVFEHINCPQKAFAEIARVLKPGGKHIFTVPIFPFRRTRARIEMDGEFRKPILPEIYHGNPIDPEGSLVTYDYGYDIAEFVENASGMKTEIVEFYQSKENFENGLEADILYVCVSEKGMNSNEEYS